MRERLRPLVTGVLDEVGLLPQNAVERVSRKKLVEELLDQVVERGYLTIGDLRDAVSRNHVKLPDVAGPGDLWRGDALLRADRRLAAVLDGVYRRGEFYMRWMQGFSSLGFGTRVGRFLTKYLVVPFGGAAMAVVFVDHMIAKIIAAGGRGASPPVASRRRLLGSRSARWARFCSA